MFRGFVSRFYFFDFASCSWSLFLFLAAGQVLFFFAYIVYIYKLYINTYIYYLILSLLQICMFPGFVFCASYARTHVYRSRFAISAMKARTHFCVFNGVVFSVDGCFLVLVRLRAVSCVSACDALFISAEATSLFSFLSGSSILMFNLHIVTSNYGAEASFSLFQLCFSMFFNSIIGTFVPFIALFGRYLHSKSTTLEALHRDLCDLVVGFTSTCLVASRFAPDHNVLQRGDCRNLGLSDLQARLHKEDRKPLSRLDVGLINFYKYQHEKETKNRQVLIPVGF